MQRSRGTSDLSARHFDPESRAWLDVLRADGPAREDAARRLHAFLVRVARFQLRKRASAQELRGEQIDDVATEAANDALITILSHLEQFRGTSRFTTWAYKFVILEISVALRRRMWKGRELPFDGDWRGLVPSAAGPAEEADQLELLQALREAVGVLTEHQREIFVAVALNDVPVDIVAARGGCTRGAVYKTLHDARRKLRAQLDELSATPAPSPRRWLDA